MTFPDIFGSYMHFFAWQIMWSATVKISLFKTFYSPAQLLCRNISNSLQRPTVAYNHGMRLLLQVPRSCRATQMFISVQVPTCLTVIPDFICSSYTYPGRICAKVWQFKKYMIDYVFWFKRIGNFSEEVWLWGTIIRARLSCQKKSSYCANTITLPAYIMPNKT